MNIVFDVKGGDASPVNISAKGMLAASVGDEDCSICMYGKLSRDDVFNMLIMLLHEMMVDENTRGASELAMMYVLSTFKAAEGDEDAKRAIDGVKQIARIANLTIPDLGKRIDNANKKKPVTRSTLEKILDDILRMGDGR